MLVVACCVLQVSVFSGQCRSGAYYHVSLGHTTAMATVTFFGAKELKKGWRALIAADTGSNQSLANEGWEEEEAWSLDDMANLPFPWGAEFAQQPDLLGQGGPAPQDSMDHDRGQSQDEANPLQYCLLQFHTPVITPPSSVILGSRLDTMASDAGSAVSVTDSSDYMGSSGEGKCRIAFHGRLVGGTIDDGKRADSELGFGTEAGKLKLFNEKVKTGVVFRVGGGSGSRERNTSKASALEVFGKDLFKKETNMSPFIGMLLHTEVGMVLVVLILSTHAFWDSFRNSLQHTKCTSIHGLLSLNLIFAQGSVVGHIESAFGKAGRFKACFARGTSIKVRITCKMET